MKLQMSFGENLINLRKQKGWSQDDLADNLNLSRQAISKWENETSKPDIDNIKKISKIFSVKIDDLLNNDVVKDKAVTLNVKKQEKKEKTITIVKCMIIAVIILYIINVIFKFASLLIIVNGIQKYANLSNYHYVITTYDENGLAEKEECWFKDGVSKTIKTTYSNNIMTEQINIFLDYNKELGYMKDASNNNIIKINFKEYMYLHDNYQNGGQYYSNLPINIRDSKILYLFYEAISLNQTNIKLDDLAIVVSTKNNLMYLDKKTMQPSAIFIYDDKSNNIISEYYFLELYCIENLEI